MIGSLDAFVLCGGLGTRLRPILPHLPKSLAPVAGRSFLDRLLEHLAGQGLERFVLCTGYREGDIRAALGPLARWGQIVLSPEAQPLGTGGALINALAEARSDPFFVLNGDSFASVDLGDMLEFHHARGARITLAVVASEQGDGGGRLLLSENGAVASFEERGAPRPGSHLSAGIYLMDREALLAYEGRSCFSLERDLFPMEIGRRLFGYVHPGTLVDIGTPERYLHAPDRLLDAGIQNPRRSRASS